MPNGSGDGDDDGNDDEEKGPQMSTAGQLHWSTLQELNVNLRRAHDDRVKMMTLLHDMHEELQLSRRVQMQMVVEVGQTREINGRMLSALERIAGHVAKLAG